MFKKISFLLVSAVSIIYLVSIPTQVNKSIAQSPIAKLSAERYSKTVDVTGSVISADTENLFLSIPIIPDKTYVKVGDRVKKGDLLFTIDIDNLQKYLENALLAGSDNKELLYYISEELGSKEKIEKALKEIKPAYYAQKSGIVTTFNLQNNTLSNPLLPVLSIADSSALIVSVDVPVESAKKIKKGQSVDIYMEGTQTAHYTGTIKSVSSLAKNKIEGTKTTVCVPVEVEFDKISNEIIPGLPADIKIKTEKAKTIYCLNYMAIGQDDEGEYVYSYNNGVLEKKYIKTGEELKGKVEVLSGVTKDDYIVGDIAKVNENTKMIKVIEE